MEFKKNDTPIRIAIAGAGMVTAHHMLAWRKLPGVHVVAICARRIERAQSRADSFGIPSAYDDVEEMLDREKPDVLDVATPPEVHAEQVLMASERNIHVLCQKPMTPDFEESKRLVARVGNRVRFMIHENWRFRPQYRQAAHWLADGAIGRVSEFQMTVRSSGLVTRAASGKPFAVERQPFFINLERFMIMEVLIHHLDTMRYLLGPASIRSTAVQRVSRDIKGEDVALIGLEAQDGAFGFISGNFSAAGFPTLPGDRLELIGERGSIVFENGVLRLNGSREGRCEYPFDTMYQQSYDNAIAHFVQALTSGTPFETDRLDNLETLRLVDDAYRMAGSFKYSGGTVP